MFYYLFLLMYKHNSQLKMHRLLDDYRTYLKVNNQPSANIRKLNNNWCKFLFEKEYIDSNTYKMLIYHIQNIWVR